MVWAEETLPPCDGKLIALCCGVLDGELRAWSEPFYGFTKAHMASVCSVGDQSIRSALRCCQILNCALTVRRERVEMQVGKVKVVSGIPWGEEEVNECDESCSEIRRVARKSAEAVSQEGS